MNVSPSFLRRSLTMTAAVALFAFLPAASAVTPATITLDVKSVSAGHTEAIPYRNRLGSYDVKDDQSRKIEISLQAIGVDQPRPMNVQIWWIGQVFGSTKLVVLHKDSVVKNVANATPAVWQSESGEVKSRDRNLRGIHYRKQTGSRISGWLVEADGGDIHLIKASDANLRALAGTEELKAMEKAAE